MSDYAELDFMGMLRRKAEQRTRGQAELALEHIKKALERTPQRTVREQAIRTFVKQTLEQIDRDRKKPYTVS